MRRLVVILAITVTMCRGSAGIAHFLSQYNIMIVNPENGADVILINLCQY